MVNENAGAKIYSPFEKAKTIWWEKKMEWMQLFAISAISHKNMKQPMTNFSNKENDDPT